VSCQKSVFDNLEEYLDEHIAIRKKQATNRQRKKALRADIPRHLITIIW